jgi:hypothetical protein
MALRHIVGNQIGTAIQGLHPESENQLKNLNLNLWYGFAEL